MKKIFWISLCIILFLSIVIISSRYNKDYIISTENSYKPTNNSVDIFNASKEELIEMDLCKYQGTFGSVNTEKDAYQIAKKVVKEVYDKDESPYIIKFNTNANAWIVIGSLPLFHTGGVASMAIDRDTGEILMLHHTK